MKFKFNRGFTLIELLVVIAIIGILSSIVLVSLNSARNKGKDARIQGETSQIRTALESEYNGSTYPSLTTLGGANAGDASTNSSIKTLSLDINGQNGQTGTNSVAIYATTTAATAYAIYTTLSTGGHACIDSVGNASSSYTGSQYSTKDLCL